ncbi:hypothetical protein HMPREF9006_0599 [Actinomyces sp. oral taxon 180 str. F0310]|nr:hypothetical protein HMPREF9006_0599 [Actinomyces sp. oral taxon 180 str. F0310]
MAGRTRVDGYRSSCHSPSVRASLVSPRARARAGRARAPSGTMRP